MLKIVIIASFRNSMTQATFINSIDFNSQLLKGTLGRVRLKNAAKVDFVMTRRDCDSLRTCNSQAIPFNQQNLNRSYNNPITLWPQH